MFIDARDLVAGYAVPVCGPVSFILGPGEILGIAGPNGCGKSTLLGAIAGGVRIFSGEIRRSPQLQVTLQTQQQPDIAGVPLSGRELLALTSASADGLPPWLAGRLDERLDQLSGGQRQYLHLWACLQAPGDAVLLDEPTNNLDRPASASLPKPCGQGPPPGRADRRQPRRRFRCCGLRPYATPGSCLMPTLADLGARIFDPLFAMPFYGAGLCRLAPTLWRLPAPARRMAGGAGLCADGRRRCAAGDAWRRAAAAGRNRCRDRRCRAEDPLRRCCARRPGGRLRDAARHRRGLSVLLVANLPLAERLGHALFDGQLYFVEREHLIAAWLALGVAGGLLLRLSRTLLLCHFFPDFFRARGRSARRAHLVFDMLVAAVLAIATMSIGVMAAFAMIFVPPLIAWQWARTWRGSLLLAMLAGLLAYLAAFALALAADQPFGPVLALTLVVAGVLSGGFAPMPGRSLKRGAGAWQGCCKLRQFRRCVKTTARRH